MSRFGSAAQGAAAGSSFGPWGAGIGAGLGFLFGGGDNNANALVPKDMQGLRQQNINLLQSFLQPGAFDAGGAGSNYFYGGGQNPLSAFLAQTSPEMATYNTAKPVLEGMLTGTGPQFERDIGAANASGGRFGSANAILRGEALRNLFNQRTQTASALGTLAAGAGSSQFDRLNTVQSQRLQLLAGLLGMSGQATLSNPIQQNNQSQQFGDAAKVFATLFSDRNKSPGVNANVGSTSNNPGYTPHTFTLPPSLAHLFPSG